MLRFFTLLITLIVLSSPAWALMEDYPIVELQALDKTTARTVTFEAKVGTTIQYGTLYIKIQSCRKAPPIEQPESAAFVQIWEVPPESEKSEWVFSGWMFASSPALSAMDHPVYDVWVLDCLNKDKQNEEAAQSETEETPSDEAELEAVDPTAEPEAEEGQAEFTTAPDDEIQSEEPAQTPESAPESAPFPTE